MKKLLIPICAAAVLLSFPACTTVEERHPSTVSTTTEETTIHRPMTPATTTQTRVIRSY